MKMKLETVRIRRFRSVEEVTLDAIGELNVLIGKNNSGKSNILFAIDSFFACIKGGNLVTADAPIGGAIDYYERRTQEPIEIEMFFSMLQSERNELVKDIVNDAPQMKNAAEGISESSRVAVLIRTIKPASPAIVVAELSLRNTDNSLDKGTRLLSVTPGCP